MIAKVWTRVTALVGDRHAIDTVLTDERIEARESNRARVECRWSSSRRRCTGTIRQRPHARHRKKFGLSGLAVFVERGELDR